MDSAHDVTRVGTQELAVLFDHVLDDLRSRRRLLDESGAFSHEYVGVVSLTGLECSPEAFMLAWATTMSAPAWTASRRSIDQVMKPQPTLARAAAVSCFRANWRRHRRRR